MANARRRVRDLLKGAVNPTQVLAAIMVETARYAQDSFCWEVTDYVDEAADAFDNAELEG